MKPGLLNQQAPAFGRLFSIIDLFVVLFSFLLVHRIYLDNLDVIPERMLVLLFTLGAAYGVLVLGGMYRKRRGMFLGEELSRLMFYWVLVGLSVGMFAFLSKVAVEVSRLWFGWSMVVAFVLLCLLRIGVRAYLSWSRRDGQNSRSIVVVGAGELGKLTIKELAENTWAGLRVDAVFDDFIDMDTEVAPGHRIAGSTERILPFIEKMRRTGRPVDQVWITLPMHAEQKTRSILATLKDSSVDVCIVPSLFGIQLMNGAFYEIADLPVINISDIQLPSVGEWFKTIFDFVVANVAVFLLLPVMVVIAVCIRLDSPGSILFRQRRYGIDGQEIEVWKFRTMNVQENDDNVAQATRNDSRITRIGNFLRRTSLDELPQFFNVLQGTMSIVGPRPHAVSHNEEYRRKIEGYMMRHKIKPGITGWAQVNGWRGETDTLEKMEQRVHYDLEYIRHWSAWLDIKILFLTVARGFTGKNAY